MKYLYIVLVFSILGCRQDSIQTQEKDFPVYVPSSLTMTHLTGFVIDQNYTPLEGCSIHVRGSLTTTNNTGAFYFNRVSIGSYGDVITCSKDGYFTGYSTVFPIGSQKMNTQIQMIAKPVADKYNPGETIKIPLSGGRAIVIPPYSLSKENGDLCFSTIYVYKKEISNPCNTLCLPVNMQISFEEQQKINPKWLTLLSIEDEFGNSLDLVPEKNIQFHVPSNPDTSFRYYFYSQGLWYPMENQQSHSPQKSLNLSKLPTRLVAGSPYSYVLFKGKVLPSSSNLKNNTITQNSYAIHSVYSDDIKTTVLSSSNGNFIIPLKANTPTKLVIADICERVLLKQKLPPYRSNQNDFFPLKAQLPPSKEIYLAGKPKRPSGQIITNGVITVHLDNGLSYAQKLNPLGYFGLHVLPCDSRKMKIQLYDLDSMKFTSFVKETNRGYSLYPIIDNKTKNFLSIQVDSLVPLVYDDLVIYLDENAKKLELLSESGHDFGSISMKYFYGSNTIPSFYFNFFSEGELVFYPSIKELSSLQISLTPYKDNAEKVSGKVTIIDIPDSNGDKHRITILFNIEK